MHTRVISALGLASWLTMSVLASAAEDAAAPPGDPVLLDRIAAVVNDGIITASEVGREYENTAAQLKRQGTPVPQREVLERRVLERMINNRIVLQYAKNTGIRVDDAMLERAMQRVAEENKLTVEGLRSAAAKEGIPFDRFREDLRNEITISRVRERDVDSRIVVTDSEIDALLRVQAAQGNKDDEYRLSHILVLVPESATPEQIRARRARAAEALAQLKAGTDFRQVAVAFSDAPDALNGGDMGWRAAPRLPTLFLDAVKTLKPGETSDVLRSANGFHILRVDGKRGSNVQVMVEQTHARHILVRLNEIVSENDARKRLLDLKDRIEHGADFAELARLHSDDTTAGRGGDLGWLSPGMTVPEFERAMKELKPGQVSDPVPSPFGLHLIQVLERRTQDMTEDRQRQAARFAIRARKSDEAFQDWVRQQRDKAYVEYHQDER